MGTYQLIDLALKLVAAGFNAAAIVEQVRQREDAGQTPREIGEWLSRACDAVLTPISPGPATKP